MIAPGLVQFVNANNSSAADFWTKWSAIGTVASALLALVGAVVAIGIAGWQDRSRKIERTEEMRLARAKSSAAAASLALAVLEDVCLIETSLGYYLDFGITEHNLAEEFVPKQVEPTDSMRSYMTRLGELGDIGEDVRHLIATMINTSRALAEREGFLAINHPHAKDNDGWLNQSILAIRNEAYDIYMKISPRLMKKESAQDWGVS